MTASATPAAEARPRAAQWRVSEPPNHEVGSIQTPRRFGFRSMRTATAAFHAPTTTATPTRRRSSTGTRCAFRPAAAPGFWEAGLLHRLPHKPGCPPQHAAKEHGHAHDAPAQQHGHSHAAKAEHGHSHDAPKEHGHAHAAKEHGHSHDAPAQHGHSHGGVACSEVHGEWPDAMEPRSRC